MAKFSIDDAFDPDDDDPILCYGTTSQTVNHISKSKARYSQLPHNDNSEYWNSSDKQINQNYFSDHSREKENITSNGHLYSCHSLNSLYSDTSNITAKTFPNERWWNHPKVREHWKIVSTSLFLLVIGIALIIGGASFEILQIESVNSTIFFVAGFICIIPGAYFVVHIYLAVKGKFGFSFYDLPVFK